VSVEPAEVFRLALTLLVLPAFFMLARRVRITTARRVLAAAFLVICFSYVVSLLDTVMFKPLMDALQHLSYGVAGTLALVGAWMSRRAAVEEVERQ
jgi:hypothetical protein